MKYRQYETPMDWLEERGKQTGLFLVWFPSLETNGQISTIMVDGRAYNKKASLIGDWSTSWMSGCHWRPFADIEALDSDDPVLTIARINAEE